MPTHPSLFCKSFTHFICGLVVIFTMLASFSASAQTRYHNAPMAYPQRQVMPVAMLTQRAVAIPQMAIPMPQPIMPVPASAYFLNFNGRFAAAPATLPAPVQYAVVAGNELQGKPYVRGGGHRTLNDYGYDCSGSVSYTLARAGLLNRPLSSKEFAGYGEAGPGRFITLYVKPGEHVFMSICGLRFDTTGGGEGEGPRWRPSARNAAGFIVRHPFGL